VCNCIYRSQDRIVGHSTDGDGFVAAFETRFERKPEGLRFVVAGAGGAARSIVEALGRAGAAGIVVANRSPERAEAVAALAPGATVGRLDDGEMVAGADVVVNATSLGMGGGPAPEEVPVPVAALGRHHLVVDIVYQPRVTPLLAAARAVGAQASDGVAMLVGQAALAFELWTGVAAPLGVMTDAALGPDPT
jgi:shikimate dehydrogenase